MSTTLALPEQTEFWKITPQGINIIAGTPEEDWRGLAKAALDVLEEKHKAHAEIMFIVGDILAYGEREYHDTYADVVDATREFIGKNIKTLQNAAWVAKSIKPHVRHIETLSLAHHEAVAKLDEAEQVRLLTVAEDENMTVAEFKRKVREEHPKAAPANPKKPKDVAVLDLADEAGITHGLEKAARFLEDQPEQPDEWSKERLRSWMPHVRTLINAFAKTEEGAKACATAATKFLNEEGPDAISKWSDAKKKKWSSAIAGLEAASTALAQPEDPM